MSRTLRLAIAAAVVLIGLFALHVQLNLGGWSSYLTRLRGGSDVRGELVVGFLPVT